LIVASSSLLHHPHLIPIPRPTPLNIPNGIRIQSADLLQYTFWIDRPTYTHRPTDGLGDRSTPLALTLAILIESDVLIMLQL